MGSFTSRWRTPQALYAPVPTAVLVGGAPVCLPDAEISWALGPHASHTWHSVVVDYEVILEQVDAQNAAVIRETLARDAVPGFLGGAYAEIFEALATQGIMASGPPFARYRVEGETFRVTAGVPFQGSVTAVGRLESGDLPAGQVASTVHVGSYDALPEAFHAVMEWVARHGLLVSGDPWESYLDGPEVDLPRTRVCFPVEPRSGNEQ